MIRPFYRVCLNCYELLREDERIAVRLWHFWQDRCILKNRMQLFGTGLRRAGG